MNPSEHLRHAATLLRQEAEKLTVQASDLRRLAYGIELLAEAGEVQKPDLRVVPKYGTVHEMPIGRPD